MKSLFFYLMLISMTLASCGGNSKSEKQNNNEPKEATSKLSANHIEVLYFHGSQRCITCRAIESNTLALLDSLYTKEKADGKIVFRVIDISDEKNEKIADKYEVTWSSLFVNGWKNGKESVNNMTEFGFSYAKNSPDEFKKGLKDKIDQMLSEL
ncbi:nitrophenyl compound nitroreductase subunit ArsF family protein [Phocaeicola paurosaccharolyticus]|uniref:nitrophenyl compound nitroreductase subunit ArsF family protein n=1 Tax=Phocaeicola paurosaccharolyticus TaxID=732242 RepID=UPI002FE12D52